MKVDNNNSDSVGASVMLKGARELSGIHEETVQQQQLPTLSRDARIKSNILRRKDF